MNMVVVALVGALVLGGTATPEVDPEPSIEPSSQALAGEPPQTTPDTVAVRSGTWVTVDVLANDVDPDDDPLTLVRVEAAPPARAEVVAGGVRARSDRTTAGTDIITYYVTDGTSEVPGELRLEVSVPTGAYRLATADIRPEPVVAGRAARITARVAQVFSDGSTVPAPVGTAFDVQFRPRGAEAYRRVSSHTVTSAGTASAAVRPERDGRWRVRVGTSVSGSDYLDVHTPTRTFRVGRTDVDPEGRKPGARARITARVSVLYTDGVYRKALAGTRAAVQFRRIGGSYRTVERVRVSTPGRVTTTVRPQATGDWRVRVGGASGRPDRVRVVTPLPPGIEAAVSGPLTRADVPYSYRPGCPVGPDRLRRVTLTHFTFAGAAQRGRLVVRADTVSDLLHVFRTAYAARFPIRKIRPLDSYYSGGTVSPESSDIRSMSDDNTSAFNCRPVVGNPYRLSGHSYGVAIDINPFENPYVTASRVYPSGSESYLRRSPYRTGMILAGGPIERPMRERGWFWGGRWSNPDYQHFSQNGS